MKNKNYPLTEEQKKKRLPQMEDYKNVQYLGMPVYNKNNHCLAWSSRPAETEQMIEKKYPWPGIDGFVYFLSNREGLFQLCAESNSHWHSSTKKSKDENITFLQATQSKNFETFLSLPHGISDFSFSPDEKWIFLTSWDQPYSTDFTEPVAFESHPFKSDADLGFKVKRNQTLWLYEKETKKFQCLLDGTISFDRPIWTPDSKAILYQGTTTEGHLCFYKINIFSDRISKPQLFAETTNVSPCLDNKSSMQFSADEKKLIFAANLPEDEFADPPALYQISLAEHVLPNTDLSQEALPLIHPDYNKNGIFSHGFPFLYREEKIQTFVTLPNQSCVYIAPKEGSLCLYSVSITETGMEIPHQITEGPDNFHTLTLGDSTTLFSLHTDPLHLPELAFLFLETGNFEMLTKENQWTEELSLTAAISHWIGETGTASHTQGFYIPPAQMDPAKKYPAILYCHGGPTGFYTTALDLEFQSLAAAGYGVMYVNPRGSTGYGKIHSQDEDAYNGNAASDLENFVLEMCRLYPYLDSSRLGVCGGSYGGYMTAYLASHNRLFQAASTHRPLLNWQMIGYASHSAGCMHTRKAFPHFPDYIKECLAISPTTYGQQITIPFQIQQSLRDANCIPEQVFQLFATIRNFQPELPCRMVLYPDSGHSLLSKGPLPLAIQHRKDNLAWFQMHL